MTRAVWHVSNHKTEILEEKHLEQTSLIKVISEYSLVSTGTERLVAQGKVSATQYDKMQVPYMKGAFSFPLKYGYSLVGYVDMPDHHLHQKRVHLLHPHQNQCWVKEEDLSVVPEVIPAQRATLASNMETALNAVWDSQVSIGDTVLIVGFGMIGALTAQLIKHIPATKIIVIEADDYRRNLASQMGFTPYNGAEPKAAYDFAFHTTGTGAGLQTCINALGKEGKVIEMSWYGNQAIQVELGDSFHVERKQIISSQVSSIPANRLNRWDFKRRKQTVFELLKNPIFDEHITNIIDLEDTPKFFNQLRQHTPQGLGWCIKY